MAGEGDVGDDQQLGYEQSRVDAAYEIADRKVEALRDRLGDTVTAGDNKTADIVKRQLETRLAQLDSVTADGAPLLLFGRVDFDSDIRGAGELSGQTLYIGRASLHDSASDDPVVVAWEAPVASAFRDPTEFRGGKAVSRKRQFVGEKRMLADIMETLYQGGQVIAGGEDPLLRVLEGRTTGELREIVATIRAEQFRLMEFPADRTLLVQGGPGTGKTIIGLHRVSVLLYRSLGALTEGDILVVGPNEVFVRYIERVLPDLGRNAVVHRPITRIGAHDISTSLMDPPSAREVKGRPVWPAVIESYLTARIGWDGGSVTLTAGVQIPADVVRARLQELRDDRATPYMLKRQQLKDWLAAHLRGRPLSADALDLVTSRLMPDRSEKQVVHDLLTGPKLLAEAASGILSAEDQAAIRRPGGNLRDAGWTQDDLPLMDEAAWQLRGSAGVGQRFMHIVLDEAQDLSPMQLRVLRRRMASGGAMTILGDLAQATSPWAPRDWESHLESGGLEWEELATLETCYRIPESLLGFANRLLPVLDVPTRPTTSVLREGDDPAVIAADSPEEAIARAVDVIDSLIFVGSKESQIGVIARREDLVRLSEALEAADMSHTWAGRSLNELVTLVLPEEVKGLEFNHVIVLEPGAIYRADPVIGPRVLYVALTRARDTLTLIHVDPLPSILTEAAPPATARTLPAASPPEESDPGSADPTDLVWRRFVATDSAMFEVTLDASQTATVVEVPLGGGAAVGLATGYAVTSFDGIAWALEVAGGRALALYTPAGAAEAAEMVVRALTEAKD